jgi:hypothetical protein
VIVSVSQASLPFAEIIDSSVVRWQSSPSFFPHLDPSYTGEEQDRRARLVDRRLDAVDAELKKTTRSRSDAPRIVARITSLAVEILPYALDVNDAYVNSVLKRGFSEVSLQLAKRARRMDASVSLADILQAARNAWTACALQLLFGKEMRLTPSIFAYSMLYPYSDNYLDDVATSSAAKLRFSSRFRRRLEGDQLAPLDSREGIIWDLVGLIESEYPREAFPQVYDSLLAIHEAQEVSLRQMQRASNGDLDIAALTVTKGGTSVLADACLAAGSLTDEEASFAFNWGVVLQLGDDLQDLESDRQRGSRTLFTEAAAQGTLDRVTNQAFHFGQTVMAEMSELETTTPALVEMLARSSRTLLIRSAAGLPQYYPAPYLERLETYSPFRFDFLREREKRFLDRRRTYAKLFEQVVESDWDGLGDMGW